MRVIQITRPGEVRLLEMPIAQPGEGEALLRVLFCGICGADVASFTGNQPFTTYPRIPGHEFSAEVVSLPAATPGLRVGDVVTANPYFNCGSCYACRRGIVNACEHNETMGVQRDGSFREYITMPVQRLVAGGGLAAKTLALVEPFAVSRHALSRAKVKPGDSVLVMGAGPIGLFALLAAKQLGARVAVADLLDNRLALAKRFGAQLVVNSAQTSLAQAAEAFTEGRGFDLCVEASGAPEALLACVEHAATGAQVVLIGNTKRETTANHSVLLKKELTLLGSRNALPADFQALIAQLQTGQPDILHMVSAVYPARQAQDAFRALANNNGTLAKVLLQFGEASV